MLTFTQHILIFADIYVFAMIYILWRRATADTAELIQFRKLNEVDFLLGIPGVMTVYLYAFFQAIYWTIVGF